MRRWAADWAESSWRHGESIMQSAQQHAESQGIMTATYLQAERMHKQNYRQSEEQATRDFEMSWRAELREAIRDELANLNTRCVLSCRLCPRHQQTFTNKRGAGSTT